MYTPDKDYQHMLDKLNILRKQKNISKYVLERETITSLSGYYAVNTPGSDSMKYR